MDTPERIDHRLIDLEVKAGFTEDMLDQLNDLVYQQQLQIDALTQALRQLHERLPESGGGADVRHARDEIPPHY